MRVGWASDAGFYPVERSWSEPAQSTAWPMLSGSLPLERLKNRPFCGESADRHGRRLSERLRRNLKGAQPCTMIEDL